MTGQAGLALFLTLAMGLQAFSQEWAVKMFETTRHDFGSVARGAKAEFEFVLSNLYVEDIHIQSARSSCGCTEVRVEKPRLKTYDKGAIIASLNTRSFQGRRGATVTVTIDKPYYAEVQLQVSSYIRSDVVLEPGSVQFGSVDQGSAADKKVAVAYAGRGNWQILDVKSANPHLQGEVVETGRSGGQVWYNLTVHLDNDSPVGYLKDHVMLVTNDVQTREIPVLVEARVLSEITVSPTSLFMGVLQPGQKVTKQVVVQGKKPFRILSISCDDDSFEFGQPADDNTPKPLHLVPVTFVAGNDSGKVTKAIRIETDLGETTPELSAYAVVAPEESGSTAGVVASPASRD